MSKTLIAYFSASGVTARAAKQMADAVHADLYEIRLSSLIRQLIWTGWINTAAVRLK